MKPAMDVFKVADVLVDYVKAKYPKDIAIIAVYGSQMRGTARADSDIDMFYIPATKRGYKASFQFILNGVGFDFWPIGWERAENMTAFNESKVAVIADSKIIYARTPKDLKRFRNLQAGIRGLRKPVYGPLMLTKAMREYRNGCLYIFNLNLPHVKHSLPAVRMEAGKLVSSLTDCWAYMNRKYLSHGWPQSRKEVLALKRRPTGAKQLLEKATMGKNPAAIVRACMKLMLATHVLIVKMQKEYGSSGSYRGEARGFYEEIKSLFNKIVAACDGKDAGTAVATALSVEGEIALLLGRMEGKGEFSDLNTKPEIDTAYRALKLPDLMKAFDPNDLSILRAAAVKLDRDFRNKLEKHGVKIMEFDSLEELRKYLP